MDSTLPPFVFQALVVVGTIGLLAALSFVFKRRRRPSVGISAPSAAQPSPTATPEPVVSKWWGALKKSRERFALRTNGDLKQLRESLEEACLGADLGLSNTTEAIEALSWTTLEKLSSTERDQTARHELSKTFETWIRPTVEAGRGEWPVRRDGGPTVIWFVGVNGVGKTTSIAKLAAELVGRGHSVLLGAGDTFRAAAAEQLETWAKRLNIPCVRGQEGADASAVLFDAIQAAKSRGIDYVLCDSAGRLHNQSQLMDALAKNRRVMDKALPGAPHEVLLVLDANTGQNMLSQAEQFQKAVGVTGLVLTKLDGTARGGAVVAVARQTGLPLRRLGLGEGSADFAPFEAHEFAAALLGLAPPSVAS